MEKYYLYILQSEKNGSFYVGVTANVKKRLQDHNSGRQRYTKSKKPWRLVYVKVFANKFKNKFGQ